MVKLVLRIIIIFAIAANATEGHVASSVRSFASLRMTGEVTARVPDARVSPVTRYTDRGEALSVTMWQARQDATKALRRARPTRVRRDPLASLVV